MMSDIPVVQNATLPSRPRPIISIGAGGIVHDAHYPAYQKAGFPIAGLYDLDPERTGFMAEKFDVPRTFSSIEEAIEHSPGNAVFDVAIPASEIEGVLHQLPDGCPVLIQKPMGESLDAARSILYLCQRKKLIAAINFQMRWAPFILAARSLIDQNLLGEISDIEIRVTVYTPWHLWPFLQTVPNAEILYHSIHYIDLMRSFLGEPRGIYAKSTRHPALPQMDGSRTTLIFDYGDMVRANVETNHFHKYGLRHQESYVKWEGARGAIKATMGLLMNYPDGEPDAFEVCLLDAPDEAHWQSIAVEGSWFPDAFIGSMASLMCHVDDPSMPLPTSVADSFNTMVVADAACRSSESGATALKDGEHF